jgi:hypothetical protein
MRKIIILSLVSLLITGITIDVIAQEVSPVVPGDRVRVCVLVAETVYLSRLVALSADTLFLEDQIAVPFTSITKLEVSRGRKSTARKNAGTGLLVGTGLGAVVGAVTLSRVWNDSGYAAFLAGGYSGLLGTLIGVVVGSKNSHETWGEVPLEKMHMSSN